MPHVLTVRPVIVNRAFRRRFARRRGRVECVVSVGGGGSRLAIDPIAWLETVAMVGAWSLLAGYYPVVEQRLWRATERGSLTHTLGFALHDPLDQLDDASAAQELVELMRPINDRQPLTPVTGAALARYHSPVINHLAELAEADPILPEGNEAFAGLCTRLVDGLAAMPGRVGLSMLVAPLRDGLMPSDGSDASATRLRRVEFRLRMFAEQSLPAALLARAEALCLARRPEIGQWLVPLDRAQLDTARLAVAGTSVERWAGPGPGTSVDPRIAGLTMSLVEAVPSRRARIDGRPVTGPLPATGAPMGKVVRPDGRRAVWRLEWSRRQLHVLIAGASGCGKTTAVLRLALDDLREGRSVVLIDPHGDLARELAAHIPADRLVLVDPRIEDTAALDLLDRDGARAAAHLLSAVQEVWPPDWVGPSWIRAFSLTLRVLTSSRHLAGLVTLADVERFITDPAWRDTLIAGVRDPALRADATHDSEVWKRDTTGGNGGPSWVQYLASKLAALTQGPGRRMFSTPPGRPLEEELRRGAAIVVALPLGSLGRETTRLAARMFLTRLTTAIAAQGDLPQDQRRPVAVFCDEAHLMTGTALTGLFAQARKFATSVHICVQAPSMLGRHLDEILTNTQTHLLGRLPTTQAEYLLDRAGTNTVRLLPTLPRYHLAVVDEDHEPTANPVVLSPIPPPALPPRT